MGWTLERTSAINEKIRDCITIIEDRQRLHVEGGEPQPDECGRQLRCPGYVEDDTKGTLTPSPHSLRVNGTEFGRCVAHFAVNGL